MKYYLGISVTLIERTGSNPQTPRTKISYNVPLRKKKNCTTGTTIRLRNVGLRIYEKVSTIEEFTKSIPMLFNQLFKNTL